MIKIGLLDVDFLNPNSTNTNKKWKKVQRFVSVFFKMFLYIAIAVMLTLLIYIAITIVISSITRKSNKIPLGFMAEGEGNPERGANQKRFIERWFGSVFMLASMVVIINLMVNFSNVITDVANKYKVGEENKEKLTIYVKNSKEVVGSGDESDSNESGNTNNDNTLNALSTSNSPSTNKILKLSDTSDKSDNSGTAAERQKIVDQASKLNTLGVGGGYCEAWVESVYRTALPGREIRYYCCAGSAGSQCVISTNTSDIVPGAVVFGDRSNPTVMCSCGRDAAHVGIYIGDGKIASCTGGITVCSVEQWQQSWGFRGWGWLGGAEDLGDGATPDGGGTSGDGTGAGTETTTINYTFKTCLEGDFMFQTQYDWEKYPAKNFTNMIGGFFITIFKIFLYGLLFFRMLILALITAVAPIVVLIAIFKRFRDERQKNSILRKWIKVYIYLVLLRPVLALIYYMLVKSNVYLVTEVPFYTVIVVIIMIIAIIKSMKKVFRSLQVSKKS